jgi:hypothetical protein
MDSLLDPLIRFAQQTLEKRGEFYPFAAVVTSRGSIEMVGADPDQDRQASQEVLDMVYDGLADRAHRGDIRSSGVCFDVHLQGASKGDAIQVSLEHVDANPVKLTLPYKRLRMRGLEYGELSASPGDRRVFA